MSSATSSGARAQVVTIIQEEIPFGMSGPADYKADNVSQRQATKAIQTARQLVEAVVDRGADAT